MKRIVPVFLALLVPAVTHAYDDGDAQLWIQLAAEVPLVEKLSFRVEEETRMGDDVSEFYQQDFYFSLRYPLMERLTLAAGYRTVFSRTGLDTGREWAQEDRPTADLTVQFPLGPWTLEDRVRVEYRMPDDVNNFFRFRNRLKLITPIHWTKQDITPWVAWEAFYSDKEDDPDWDRHRLYIGLDGTVVEDLCDAQLYYCLQRDRQKPDWHDIHVAGIAIDFHF
jgi:hypothetical protein